MSLMAYDLRLQEELDGTRSRVPPQPASPFVLDHSRQRAFTCIPYSVPREVIQQNVFPAVQAPSLQSMLTFESPYIHSADPSHVAQISPPTSPISNDGFFWDQNSMCDQNPFSSFSHHTPGHRRFSYAGTTASDDSGVYSGYSVSSILHGSAEVGDHLMDSLSSMSGGSNVGSSNTPDTDHWSAHTTPPHSAPPIPRSEPFEYFSSHPVTCVQTSLPTFQDAYVSTASMGLRPPLWPHPFRSVVPPSPGHLLNHEILSPWASSALGSAGPSNVPLDAPYGRMGFPWPQEPNRFGTDLMEHHSMMMASHQAPSHQHMSMQSSHHGSDTSSEGGSISSPGPVMSPSYYGPTSSQSGGLFSFSGHPGHSHPALHRTKSSPTSFGRSESDSSGQVCAVCGDHAACQHYGVRTCEGCKGFFKRTVQKGSKYVCLGNKDCLVDKKRRNRCQFCRYQKCLAVGMVKEVVRTDSLKGRRGRLPSKPKNLGERERDSSSRGSSSRYSMSKADLIANLVRAHQESAPQISLDYQTLGSPTIKSTQEEIERFLNVLTHSVTDVIAIWTDKIAGFHEVSQEDRDVLINSAALELISLRLSHRLLFDTAVGPDRIRFCNGVTYPREMVSRIMGLWFTEIEQLSRSLQRLDLDNAGFACLCALVLVQDRPFLSNNVPVLNLRTKIIDALREYSSCNVQSRHNWFPHLLPVKLQEIQTAAEHARHRLSYLCSQYPINFPGNLRRLLENRESD